ncbi:extracellular solute-binding protein [Neptuniibacter sp. QD72_48]|uniref:extracellular solute-binding protein n=1 Tax=unclassified Neptuniibacter TaxID=2630693 RepID=UPI0039F63DC4
MKIVFRSFFYIFSLTLVSALSIAGEQADKAIEGVKMLVAQGSIAPGSVIRLVAKQGNIVNFLGKDHGLKNRWEAATGILIDAKTMPQQASIDYIQNHKDVDLTVARNREYADLYHSGLIVDLTPFIARFNFEFLGSGKNSFLMPYKQAFYAGTPVAIPADGDIALLYLRRDLLEDPENQQAYQKQFNETLKVPETWAEYQRQVAFFHKPGDGFYGSVEQRDEASAWMFWMPRYVSQGYPNQFLFDDNMKPLIESEAGIAATESYLATLPYSPSDILDQSSNYTYTLPIFMSGKGYSTMITLAGAKIFNSPHSKVREKYIAVSMPGTAVGNIVNRRTTLIYGNNLVIPSTAQNKELAFLFAMWLTDPDVSELALSEKGGFSDPYRMNHFESKVIQATYGMNVLEVALRDIPVTVPAGTGLPGDTDYIAALNKQLFLASKGEKSAKEAMRVTAQEWERITEKYGREQQIKYWLKMKTLFPTVH